MTIASTLVRGPAGGLSGYIHIHGEDFAVHVQTGTHATLEGCSRTRAALEPHHQMLLRRLQHCSDAHAVVAEITQLLERRVSAEPAARLPPAAFYELLIGELDRVG